MSVLLFLARNYSEDADENMVVDVCMNHTHDEPYTFRTDTMSAACRTL